MKKILLYLISASLIISLSGCFGTNKAKPEINLYFKDAQTNELSVEKIRYSSSQNTVDMANFAMKKLLEGPSDIKYINTIAENVTCSSVTIKNETATVNFSKEFSSLSGADELNARFSVVRTLCEIPGINKVNILVEGKPLVSNATGKEVGVLGMKDIVFDLESVPKAVAETTTIKLYFTTSDAMALKSESRNVDTQDTISIEKSIMNELMKGPASPELINVIPSGTKLLNIETKDGVCYVNLSSDFISKFSGGTGMFSVYSIVNSLCSLESVSSVQILIEGEKGAEFGNYVFDEPIGSNMSIVVAK